MDESVEGISVTENDLATPGSNTYVIREVMSQVVPGTSVDEDILETTYLPNADVVFEQMDITAKDITMTENLVAIPGPSAEGIGEMVDQIAEVNIENREATFIPNTEGIPEMVDEEVEVINAIGNFVATPGPSAEGIGEMVDQIAEVKIENREATFIPNTEGIPEIVDEEVEGINAIGNFVATPEPSVEGVRKAMDLTAEDFKVTENLKVTPASGTDVFTEIMNVDEVSETESLVTVPGSSPEGSDEIIDQITEDISLVENLEAIPLPNTERVGEINDKIAEGLGVTENLEATSVSSKSVTETHVENENTTNILFNKEMSKTENETENETSKAMNSKAKNLKVVHGHKSKNLKRKFSHPPISEMLMDCIKSLKKSSGVSFEDIKTRMEENYSVNIKALLKYHVMNYLQKWVEIGILEKVKEADLGERFRIKENEISYENDSIIQAKC